MARPVNTSGCEIEGCAKPFLAKSLYSMHWARLSRNGNPNTVQRERLGMSATTTYGTWRGMKRRAK